MTPQEWERFEKVIDATKQLKDLLVVASIEDQVENTNDT